MRTKKTSATRWSFVTIQKWGKHVLMFARKIPRLDKTAVARGPQDSPEDGGT